MGTIVETKVHLSCRPDIMRLVEMHYIEARQLSITGLSTQSVEAVLPLLSCLLGHWCVLHGTVSMAAPTHGSPPFWGAGLLHERHRDFVPPPQVLVQEPNTDQGPQPPFTSAVKSPRAHN